MKKLQLNVEALRVESFVADTKPQGRGTVHARNDTNNSACWTYGTMCWPGCGSGAGDTCDGSCQSCNQVKSVCLDCEI